MKRTAVVNYKRLALCYGFILAMFGLIACGTSEKHENAYREAQTVPKIQVPEDLVQPVERRAISDVPEDLDTGVIPKDLELPPVMTGIEIEEQEKAKSTDESEDDEPVQRKKTLKSKIISNPDNTQLLAVESDIDTVWPRVDKAIKKIGFTIDDSNRGKFYYSISREFERMVTIQDPNKPIEKDFDTPKEQYLIYVEPGQEYIEITVRNMQSEIEGTQLARQLLQQIQSYLGNP